MILVWLNTPVICQLHLSYHYKLSEVQIPPFMRKQTNNHTLFYKWQSGQSF